MRLHTAVLAPSHCTQRQNVADLIPSARHQILRFPAEGKIRRRNHLDKIHVVERRIVGHLVSPIKRVDMVVGPRRALGPQFLRHGFGNLRPKTQLMDLMRKRVTTGDGGIQVIVQIMDMHRAAAEAAAGRNVEIPDNLVDPEAAFNPAALLPLGVQLFGIMHTFALLDVLPAPKCPRDRRIRLPHLVTGVTAALFGRLWRSRCAVAVAAV